MAHAPTLATDHRRNGHPLSVAVTILAVVLLIMGVAGFIPGVTTSHDGLMIGGRGSTAMLFGVFQVSILQNVIHMLLGVFGVALARPALAAKTFLTWGGASFFALWVYGAVIDLESAANVISFNTADNWLNFALGVFMTGLGLGFSGSARHFDRINT